MSKLLYELLYILLIINYILTNIESYCNKCIYYKKIFPKYKYCIYYQEYLKEDLYNCSKYKLKNIDW